jgi:hypothetical protein
MNPAQLGTLSEDFILGRIGELTGADLATADIDGLKLGLFPLIAAYVSPTITIAKNKSLFRVRKHPSNRRREKLTSVSEIYPSDAVATRRNRANREGNPMFYFSTSQGTALREARASAGDTCTILECRSQSGLSPLLIPVGIHESARKQDVVIGGGLPEPLARLRSHIAPDDEFHKYLLIHKFVREQFLRRVDGERGYEYNLSIAIAEILLQLETSEFPIDGLAYPSIAAEEIGANLAILPSAFRRIYKPVACEWIIISNTLPNQGFSASIAKARHIDCCGNIEW